MDATRHQLYSIGHCNMNAHHCPTAAQAKYDNSFNSFFTSHSSPQLSSRHDRENQLLKLTRSGSTVALPPHMKSRHGATAFAESSLSFDSIRDCALILRKTFIFFSQTSLVFQTTAHCQMRLPPVPICELHL